jgi:alanine-synthesizing transaminase
MAIRTYFSRRTGWDTRESLLARELRVRLVGGLSVLDLTVSNPTHAGFAYDEPAVLRALGSPESLSYEPDPKGIPQAREAVAEYYRETTGGAADPDPAQVVLTTSTSEAYSYLFRLLCDAGDEVLIARPSYPLFDFLARLDDVQLTAYPLFYDHGWHLDTAALRAVVTPRTRAVALVHPNNPTGHFTGAPERRELESICEEHGLALIVDEVFLDYPLAGHAGESFAKGPHPVLTFVLSGLSKVAGLPQMKAAWITGFGPGPDLATALERLEVIADTFLSMNAPVQHALGPWLAGRQGIQAQIARRTAANLAALDALLAGQELISRQELEAGWYATLRVPALMDGEELAARLVRERGISVHPGEFFGFSRGGYVVVSLLTPESSLATGVAGILRFFRDLSIQS